MKNSNTAPLTTRYTAFSSMVLGFGKSTSIRSLRLQASCTRATKTASALFISSITRRPHRVILISTSRTSSSMPSTKAIRTNVSPKSTATTSINSSRTCTSSRHRVAVSSIRVPAPTLVFQPLPSTATAVRYPFTVCRYPNTFQNGTTSRRRCVSQSSPSCPL